MTTHKQADDREPLKARFLTKVSKTETCWLWTGTRTKDGYGRLRTGQTAPRAHRLSYELFVGPIAEGLQVDHLCHGWDSSCAGGPTCRHRRCVNPAHLEAVTPRVNNRRGQGPAAKAAKRTHCPKGHPYDAANTLDEGDGARRCRTCRRASARKRVRPPRPAVPMGVLRLIEAHFPGEHHGAVIERAVRAMTETPHQEHP